MADNFQFLHIGFDLKTATNEQIKALQNTFNEATDWIRYTGNSWVLYTSQTPQVWTNKIRSTPGVENASFIIVPISASEKWGIHQKWVWEWFEKVR